MNNEKITTKKFDQSTKAFYHKHIKNQSYEDFVKYLLGSEFVTGAKVVTLDKQYLKRGSKAKIFIFEVKYMHFVDNHAFICDSLQKTQIEYLEEEFEVRRQREESKINDAVPEFWKLKGDNYQFIQTFPVAELKFIYSEGFINSYDEFLNKFHAKRYFEHFELERYREIEHQIKKGHMHYTLPAVDSLDNEPHTFNFEFDERRGAIKVSEV